MIEDKIRKFYEALTAMVAAIQEVSSLVCRMVVNSHWLLVGRKNKCTAVRAGQARFRPIGVASKFSPPISAFVMFWEGVWSRVTINNKTTNETRTKI